MSILDFVLEPAPAASGVQSPAAFRQSFVQSTITVAEKLILDNGSGRPVFRNGHDGSMTAAAGAVANMLDDAISVAQDLVLDITPEHIWQTIAADASNREQWVNDIMDVLIEQVQDADEGAVFVQSNGTRTRAWATVATTCRESILSAMVMTSALALLNDGVTQA